MCEASLAAVVDPVGAVEPRSGSKACGKRMAFSIGRRRPQAERRAGEDSYASEDHRLRLVCYRGDEAKRGVNSSPVVERFDVVENLSTGNASGLWHPAVQQILLEGCEETFGNGVVPTVAATTHAGSDLMVDHELTIVIARVLAAPVAVEEQARSRPPLSESHPQGGQSQFVGDPGRHRPSHDDAREQVDHDRQVQPAFRSPHVGNVANPNTIRRSNREFTGQDVRCDRPTMVRLGRHPKLSPMLGSNAGDSHHPRDSVLRDRILRRSKLLENPRASIGATARFVNRTDLLQQTIIGLGASTRPSAAPGVVAAACDLQDIAQHPDRIKGPLRVDESVSHRLSFAKKAVAFFRISRSIRSRPTSFLSRRISACSAVSSAC